MRADTYLYPHSTTLAGIILSAEKAGRDAGCHKRVQLGHEGDLMQAISVCDPLVAQALEGPLTARSLHLVRSDGDITSLPLLVALPEDPFNDGLVHLPECVCPVEGIVLGTKSLISGVHTPPLRMFLTTVFQRRDVFDRFWTMPASAKHHHATPGGLAAHSFEVADDLACHNGLTDLELDLGIAGALLHDIGKVWSYTHDMFLNAAALAMGHELVGLSRLEPELVCLESTWPDGAYAMRCLLSGQSRPRENGSLPSSLLPRIKACDQRSCERERVSHGKGRYSRPVWTPSAWRDQLPHGDMGVP